MSRINRPPIGLQKLLGSKNFGDNPAQLAAFVSPTVDLTQFFAANLIKVKGDVASRSSVGKVKGISFDHPIGLIGCSYEDDAALGATGTFGITFGFDDLPGDTSESVHLFREYQSFPAGSVPTFVYQAPYPIVLPAGCQVHMTANMINATLTGQFVVAYVDLS